MKKGKREEEGLEALKSPFNEDKGKKRSEVLLLLLKMRTAFDFQEAIVLLLGMIANVLL